MKKTIQFLVAMATLSHGMANANLVAHYTFNETSGTTAADSSPSGANGTIGTNVTLGVPGKFGTAFTFNNDATQNGIVDMGNATAVFTALNASQAMTVSVWLKWSPGTGARDCAVFLGTDTATARYVDVGTTTAGGMYGRTRNGNDSGAPFAGLDAGTALNDGQWHHVAYTTNATTDVTQIYVDGAQIGTTTTPVFTFPAFNNFEIGRLGRSGPTDAFAGSIDELRIYDRVLSYSEIGQLAGVVIDPVATVQQTAVDFGSLPAPSLQTRTVTVKNEGASNNLSVTDVQVFGDLAFTTTQVLPVVIPPGASRDVSVTFDPGSAEGNFSGIMEIYTNAQTGSYFNLPLSAEVKLANPGANLVSHFTFDDEINLGKDSGSLQNDGTVVGDAKRTTSARVGAGALQLDGTGDLIDLGVGTGADYTTDLVSDGDGFTVACWAQVPTTTVIDRTRFFSSYANGAATLTEGWGVGRRNASRALISTTYSRADFLSANNVAPAAGDWHHYAYVFRNAPISRVDSYINGVRVASQSTTALGLIDSTTVGFAIGALGRSNAFEGFDGNLDDLRIYNRELVAANIVDIYNLGVAPTSGYGTWAASFGLNPATTGAYSQDPDNDGLSNSLEYLLGTSPISGASGNRPVATKSAANLTVVYRRKLAAVTGGFADQVQYSETLAEGSWTTAQHNTGGVTITATAVDAETEEVTVTIPSAGVKKFARLRVVAP